MQQVEKENFPKTLALNMLKVFFEQGSLDNAAFFRYRKIWQCGAYYQGFQGRYPVIYLSFKDIKCSSWDESLEKLALLLQNEYARHIECLDKLTLTSYKDYYQKILSCSANKIELSEALGRLSLLLAQAYKSKVVILIDEYDTPIQQGYSKGFYQEMLDFMRNLLSGGLKDNDNLFKGVLTGILRVSKENLFSGLNNVLLDTVTDKKYAQYFGFTEAEVQAMAKYYDRAEQFEEIKQWYDGYRFGDVEIYNPWSVTNYFNNLCEPQPFWANTSENVILKELLADLDEAKAESLTALLMGKSVIAKLNFNIIYPKLKDTPDAIYSFLLLAGYLKCVNRLDDGYYELAVPNNEVKQIYREEILEWLGACLSGNIANDLRKALILCKQELLESKLEAYMKASVSFFDYTEEGFYHGFMLGLVASLADRYYIKSNREAGKGRFDLQLEPKHKLLPGIVMEFKAKADASERDLQLMAESALEQITQKAYTSELQERGVTRIISYGIAFCGKEAKVCSKAV